MPPSKRTILVIDDEPHIIMGLRDALEFEGFRVIAAGKGKEGIALARTEAPDAIILDLMLPDVNGYAVCEELRKINALVPIVMLTARSQETDKIRGLDVGADDYVTKPFSIGELVARIKAIFRRLHRVAVPNEEIQIGAATIDPRKHELTRKGKTSALSFYEVELLRLLWERAGQPVTREEILEKIWGVSGHATTRSVDNFVVKLRKTIEENAAKPHHIITIYGTGYKLVL